MHHSCRALGGVSKEEKNKQYMAAAFASSYSVSQHLLAADFMNYML